MKMQTIFVVRIFSDYVGLDIIVNFNRYNSCVAHVENNELNTNYLISCICLINYVFDVCIWWCVFIQLRFFTTSDDLFGFICNMVT